MSPAHNAVQSWEEPVASAVRLTLHLLPRRPLIVLNKANKPVDSGETLPPMVEMHGLAGMFPVTSSPERLRTIAAMFLEAANALELLGLEVGLEVEALAPSLFDASS